MPKNDGCEGTGERQGAPVKFLRVEQVDCDVRTGRVRFRIVAQSHRNRLFGPEGHYIFSHNNFDLISDSYPCYYGVDPTKAFVRGSSFDKDDEIIDMPIALGKRFLDAVDAYNAFSVELKYVEIIQTVLSASTCAIRIIGQSHRGSEFGEAGEPRWKASNGCVLVSLIMPALHADGLFVRGDDQEQDDLVVLVAMEQANRIYDAVVEYNHKFGNGSVVEFPKMGYTKLTARPRG